MKSKRVMDLILAGIGLVVLAPLLLVVALLVRISSPGPTLFRQERIGLHGHPFEMVKFRTMYLNNSGDTLSSTADVRVTTIGRALRLTKIDELPQLFNVLRGEMSLVGPRPELPKYVSYWTVDDREKILSILPGITDPASVRFRNEDQLLAESENPENYYITQIMPKKIEMYREYVESQSMLRDLQLILQTVGRIVR